MKNKKLEENNGHLVILGRWNPLQPVIADEDYVVLKIDGVEQIARVLKVSREFIQVISNEDQKTEKSFEVKLKNIFGIHKQEQLK